MKEGSKSEVFARDPTTKQKRRPGRSNFSKWRKKRNEREEKESMPIEGRGAPADFRDSIDIPQGVSWRGRCKIRPLILEQMEELSDSLGLDMVDCEVKSSSIHSDEDRQSTVSTSFRKWNLRRILAKTSMF